MDQDDYEAMEPDFDFVEWANENDIETDWDNWASVEISFNDETGLYEAEIMGVEGTVEVEFTFTQDDFTILEFLDWLDDYYDGWIEYDVDIDS